MKLQLTKAIIYFAAILLLCIGFSACEKEDENILNSNDSLCEVSFFDHKIQDEALSTIIDSLVTLDQNKNFTDRISLDYGYPLWEHAVSVSNE